MLHFLEPPIWITKTSTLSKWNGKARERAGVRNVDAQLCCDRTSCMLATSSARGDQYFSTPIMRTVSPER